MFVTSVLCQTRVLGRSERDWRPNGSGSPVFSTLQFPNETLNRSPKANLPRSFLTGVTATWLTLIQQNRFVLLLHQHSQTSIPFSTVLTTSTRATTNSSSEHT